MAVKTPMLPEMFPNWSSVVLNTPAKPPQASVSKAASVHNGSRALRT